MPSASTPTEQINANAIFTAAAQTVEVKLTQNSLSNPTNPPATLTPPPPTNQIPMIIDTPTAMLALPSQTQPVILAAATSACDVAQFINDVTISDGTVFGSGNSFTKTWQLKNVGTCTWSSSYSLVFDSGSQMGGPASVPLPASTVPGASVNISVNLQAPATDGSYTGFWGLTNSSGARLPILGGTSAKSFYVQIKVGSGVPANTPGGPTSTDSPGKFAVTHVGFSATRSGACAASGGKYIINVAITTNKAGTVTYTWIRSDGGTDPTYTLVFDGAVTQTVTYEWNTTGTGLWVDIYIDKPNHYEYQRANLNCP
jgi:hypothetical protein